MKLISYISNGYPSMGDSRDLALRYHGAGIDAVQIDLPAADPYLEGPHIARRMLDARERSLDWDAYMENIASIREACPDLSIFLLAYEDTIGEIGEDHFLRFCEEENLLDITLIGSGKSPLRERCLSTGLRVSSYVQFQLDRREIDSAKRSNGFVYLQAKPQVPRNQLRFDRLADCIDFLRLRIGPVRKIYTGVGLRTTEDAVMARRAGSDGIFVGSTFLQLENHPGELDETVRSFKRACQGD